MAHRSDINGFEDALTPGVYEAAWRHACRLSASWEDAEDLLQESLVCALKGFYKLREPGNFKSWLLSIVRNNHLMKIRKSSSGIAQFTDTFGRDGEPLVDYVSAPGAKPVSDELVAALERLPAVQRELVSLFYFEGLSLKETARVLQTTPNAVTQRLHRARAALKRELGCCGGSLRAGVPHKG